MRNLWPCEQVILVYLSELQCGSNYSLEFCITILVCCCLVAKFCLTLLQLMDCSLPDSSVHGILQARILEWVAISFSRGSSQPKEWMNPHLLHWQADSLPWRHKRVLQAKTLECIASPFSRGSSQPRDKPRSLTLWVDSLPGEPQRKLKNTEMVSLSLFQGIFPT